MQAEKTTVALASGLALGLGLSGLFRATSVVPNADDLAPDAAVRRTAQRGFSSTEALDHVAKTQAAAKAATPQDVLDELQRGNARFWMGVPDRPECSALQRRSLLTLQHPNVAVIGCADSVILFFCFFCFYD
tara:strand:+ start:78 stop:473 length:396 start_codon:yes stop_codon:yes gene_type:complete